DYLRATGNPNPTPDEIMAQYIRVHVEAGDLSAVTTFAQRIGQADLRGVAIPRSPLDPTQEYVELQKAGTGCRQMARGQLSAPIDVWSQKPTYVLVGSLDSGERCRIYTQRANQVDACQGRWQSSNVTGIWPARGETVLAQQQGGDSRRRLILDRWYFELG